LNDEGYSKENLLHFKDDEDNKIEVFKKLVIAGVSDAAALLAPTLKMESIMHLGVK
jgi:hypothetical protein